MTVQPALDGTVPEPADDYETWVDTVRPTFVTVAATGRRFVSWQIKHEHKLPDPPDPAHDWGKLLSRLHREGLIEPDGFGFTRDRSCVNAWRGTRAAREGRAA
jgi:hypothetical protein